MKARDIPGLALATLLVAALLPAAAVAAPALTDDTSGLAGGSNSVNAATVYYGGDAWRVIGYDGQSGGVASTADAVTLIAASNMGYTKFDSSGNFGNVYANSTLREQIEGEQHDGTAVGGIVGNLTAAEKGAITPRKLVKGDYGGSDTDCVAGTQVDGALLWPLSTKEANSMDDSLRALDPEHPGWASSYWWLRSPGMYQNCADTVERDGSLGTDLVIFTYHAVRPVLWLDLNADVF